VGPLVVAVVVVLLLVGDVVVVLVVGEVVAVLVVGDVVVVDEVVLVVGEVVVVDVVPVLDVVEDAVYSVVVTFAAVEVGLEICATESMTAVGDRSLRATEILAVPPETAYETFLMKVQLQLPLLPA
jgi:hypothetical protein